VAGGVEIRGRHRVAARAECQVTLRHARTHTQTHPTSRAGPGTTSPRRRGLPIGVPGCATHGVHACHAGLRCRRSVES
jgi:hypothetical protein